MTSKKPSAVQNYPLNPPPVTEDVARRVVVIAKLYGDTVLDWPGVKRLLQQHLPPDVRCVFTPRASNKRIPWPTAGEKQFIVVWETITGAELLYPAEKMQVVGVSTVRRGQSTHGINRRQKDPRATPKKTP